MLKNLYVQLQSGKYILLRWRLGLVGPHWTATNIPTMRFSRPLINVSFVFGPDVPDKDEFDPRAYLHVDVKLLDGTVLSMNAKEDPSETE